MAVSAPPVQSKTQDSSAERNIDVANELAKALNGLGLSAEIQYGTCNLIYRSTIYNATASAVFMSDGGEVGQWAQNLVRCRNRIINGIAGSIGAALPFASA
jgi:hypothetical protein